MDYDDAYAVLDSGLRQEWDQRAQAITQCIPLAHLDIGFRQLTANKEIHSADLKGVKIRTMVDPIQMNCWEAFWGQRDAGALCGTLHRPSAETGRCPGESALNIVSSKIYEMPEATV